LESSRPSCTPFTLRENSIKTPQSVLFE